MKLSEAMRKGCEIYPNQLKHTLILHNCEAACALGAAYAGLMGPTGKFVSHGMISEAFPILKGHLHDKGGITGLAAEIVQRNDEFGWSRERIADWLEEKGL